MESDRHRGFGRDGPGGGARRNDDHRAVARRSLLLFRGLESGGFEPFGDARRKFDVRFYLVAILFIIFDLEVAFLFPWAVTLGKIGIFGFWSMMIFLGILTIGFIYEWRKGALEWE